MLMFGGKYYGCLQLWLRLAHKRFLELFHFSSLLIMNFDWLENMRRRVKFMHLHSSTWSTRIASKSVAGSSIAVRRHASLDGYSK